MHWQQLINHLALSLKSLKAVHAVHRKAEASEPPPNKPNFVLLLGHAVLFLADRHELYTSEPASAFWLIRELLWLVCTNRIARSGADTVVTDSSCYSGWDDPACTANGLGNAGAENTNSSGRHREHFSISCHFYLCSFDLVCSELMQLQSAASSGLGGVTSSGWSWSLH